MSIKDSQDVAALQKRVKELEGLLFSKDLKKIKKIAVLTDEEREYAINGANGAPIAKKLLVRLDQKTTELLEAICGDYSQNAVINVLLKEAICTIAKNNLDKDPAYIQVLYERHHNTAVGG